MNPLVKILIGLAVLVGLLYLSAVIFREIGFFFSNLLWWTRNNLLIIVVISTLAVVIGGYVSRKT
ncbi:MAG: hypothetical protein HC919_01660 [Oscillatoriales cyanobacterium SM2_2_1]|nr:hypothetical protein [Oscillatoriales cyanobacterium SM2_2_1]